MNRRATAPILYLTFPGTAREALEFYADVFGGELPLHTFGEFSRTDGPAEAIAHGSSTEDRLHCSVPTPEPAMPPSASRAQCSPCSERTSPVLHRWFDRLAEGGTILDPLAPKPWRASDCQVVDRYGLRWLLGYEPDE